VKLITRDTDYAIRALCCIATHEKEVMSVKELVKCISIPRPFLRKILQLLNKKGLVRSYKGKGGGFSLAVPPEKISVVDMINIFQGPIELNEHTFKKRPCPNVKRCKLKNKIDRLENFVITELLSVNIASLIK